MQSQKHGFTIENEIRKHVFGLEEEKNNTDKHDIPSHKNRFDHKENISIKTSSSLRVCCGDIMRFMNYDFSERHTLIVVQY